jgi:Mrp family chromosome partitioning ATPase
MKPVEESFRYLRVRVQHDAFLPAVLAIGSAERGDGTTFVACGLAQAFAEAGRETLILDANPRASGISAELGLVNPIGSTEPVRVAKHLSVASFFDGDERLFEDDELTEMLTRMRSEFAVTIIDVPVIPGSGAALQITRVVEGLLIAVRLGRRPTHADHELKVLMQPGGLLGDKLISGIVPTRAAARRALADGTQPATIKSSIADIIGRATARFQSVNS